MTSSDLKILIQEGEGTTLEFKENLSSNPEVRSEVDAQSAVTGEVTPQVTPQVRLLQMISGEMTRQQMRNALDLKDDKHFRKTYLLPTLQSGLIEMTIPDKPRSSKQRYRLMPAGREYLKQIKGAE